MKEGEKMKSVLSVDVAKNKSMFLLMNSEGEILIDTKEYTHNLSNFNELKERINELKLEDLTVFMESTGTYHLPVERFFRTNNFKVIVINGLSNKNNFDTIRKTKTDKQDCIKLAKLFFVAEHKQHNFKEEIIYKNLKLLVRQYFFLVDQNVNCKNRLKRLINLCFPEYEEIFKKEKIYEDTALNFIQAFPHAYIIKEKRIDALYNNLYKTNGRHLKAYKSVANKIKDYANISYPGVDKDSTDVENLVVIAKVVQKNQREITSLKEKMISLAQTSPLFKIISSYYGIGELSASILLGELGDITRFDNEKQLIAFCGLDPTITQSGKSVNIHGSISKRGDKYVRKILFNICQNTVKICSKHFPNHPIYEYYIKKKNEGKHYYERLTMCSTKLLRTLLAMCKKNEKSTLTK